MDARVAQRQAIVEIGRAHLGRDFKADGLSNREIKMKVLGKLHPAGEIADTLRADSADAPVSKDPRVRAPDAAAAQRSARASRTRRRAAP
jgi:hypothetical protein